MSYFEPVQDVTPLVIDFGTAYTKCGFAGENAPRCIVSSNFKRKNGQVFNVHDDSLSEEELHESLSEFFYHLYFRELLVNPKVRKVVVVEGLFITLKFKHAVAHVLFVIYEIPSIFFSSSHVFSLLSLGIKAGLVVDCGYQDCVILPVYHSQPILKACKVSPCSAQTIHRVLRCGLLEEGKVLTENKEELAAENFQDVLTDKLIENIKVKTCFVTRFDRAQQIRAGQKPTPLPQVNYPLNGKLTLIIPGSLREEACESLFDRDEDECGVALLILQSIKQCPIDTRKELLKNIVLVGGCCMLPGFRVRLLDELKSLSDDTFLKGVSFKIHTTPCPENIAPWLGGSIVASVQVLLGMRSTLRDQYLNNKKLADWSDLRLVDVGNPGHTRA